MIVLQRPRLPVRVPSFYQKSSRHTVYWPVNPTHATFVIRSQRAILLHDLSRRRLLNLLLPSRHGRHAVNLFVEGEAGRYSR